MITLSQFFIIPTFAFGKQFFETPNTKALLPESKVEYEMYEVVDEYSVIRDTPYKSGHIVRHFHSGEYVKGKIITNSKSNEWLCFENEKNELNYIYSSHIKKQTVHCWDTLITSTSGKLQVCACGYVSVSFNQNSAANLTLDGVDYLKQILLGNYSQTHSFTSAFATLLLGLTPIGILTDIRDLSADVYYCTQGDCNVTSLVLDFVAFIPLLDSLRHADSLRAVNVLDNDDLYAFSDDLMDLGKVTFSSDTLILSSYQKLRELYAGKSRMLDIEIHHTVEKRFEVLFDADPNDYLSTPLWSAEHDVITARWREAIPYDMNYSEITLSQMRKAVDYVYSDNTLLRNYTQEWITQHWNN